MILVTGANGFIGSQIVRKLSAAGERIVAVDPVPQKERPLLLPPGSVEKFLHRDELWSYLETQPALTWVIHMGANSSTTETNKQHLDEVNTFYTQKLFTWCANAGVPMVLASSAATYGNGELGYDDTLDPNQLKPLNLYGESKLAVDRWLMQPRKTPPHWYSLRFFNVYGPGETYKANMISVPFKAYHDILKTGSLKLFKSYKPGYADGEQKRDFIYVKDIVDWILELREKNPPSGIYNMGTGKARSWVDLGKASFAALNKKTNIEFMEMPESLRAQYQYFTEARMDKWLAAGMSAPKWSLEKGIADYYLNHLSKDS